MTLVCESNLNQVTDQFISFLQLHLYKKKINIQVLNNLLDRKLLPHGVSNRGRGSL